MSMLRAKQIRASQLESLANSRGMRIYETPPANSRTFCTSMHPLHLHIPLDLKPRAFNTSGHTALISCILCRRKNPGGWRRRGRGILPFPCTPSPRCSRAKCVRDLPALKCRGCPWPLIALGFRLPPVNCGLSTVNCRLSAVHSRFRPASNLQRLTSNF